MSSLSGALEALLFVVGEEGLSKKEMSQIFKCSATDLDQALENLEDRYSSQNSGLQLILTADRYKLATQPAYEEVVKEFAQSEMSRKLTKAQLETLAIIAYKQPITRVDIDDIRGVQSSSLLTKLQLYGLIDEAGRMEVPGRPILYETTDYFLDYFGLNSLEDLPAIEEEEEGEEDLLFSQQTQLDLKGGDD